jgi:hypothetical protein
LDTRPSSSVSHLDVFVVAAWAAVVFGLAEGIVLNVARAYPVILAPYKASAHLLWIAPLLDLPLFLLAAAGLLILFRLTRRWTSGIQKPVLYGFFMFIGIFTVVEAPKLIHLIATGAISLGLTVVITQKLRSSEDRLTYFLRRQLAWVPVLIIVAAAGVYGYELASELWRMYQLDPHQIVASTASGDLDIMGTRRSN